MSSFKLHGTKCDVTQEAHREGLRNVTPLLALAALCLASCLCLPCAADEAQPGEATPAARQKIIRISPETTRITGPLDDAGFVDYAEAINQIAGKGVTPENNFEVVMRRVFGLDAIPEEYHDEYCRRLGIAKPAGQVTTIGDFGNFLSRRKQPGEEQQDLWAQVPDDYYQLNESPWTAAEHPEAAKWLKSIEPQLDALVAGSRRKRLFIPRRPVPGLESSDGFSSGGTFYEEQRSVAQALSRRAMFRLGHEDVAGAWSDLQAIHRVARLLGGGVQQANLMTASEVEYIALAADRIVLQSPHPTDALARQFLADMKQLTPLPNMASVLDVGERYWRLDYVQWLAREPPSRKEQLEGVEFFAQPTSAEAENMSVPRPQGRETRRLPVVAPLPDTTAVDWNEVLGLFNQLIDRQVAAVAEQDPAQQKKLLATLRHDMDRLHRELGQPDDFKARLLTAPPQAAGQLLGKYWAIMLLDPDILSLQLFLERRFQAELELTRLAFAVEVYRRNHGQYPPELASLVPKYIETVPSDPLSDKPLKYVRATEGFVVYSTGGNDRDDSDAEAVCPSADPWKNDDVVIRIRKPGKPQPDAP